LWEIILQCLKYKHLTHNPKTQYIQFLFSFFPFSLFLFSFLFSLFSFLFSLCSLLSLVSLSLFFTPKI
ncbi:hypothetical protein ACMBCN_02905, partial [Candidatus Liberibacter asiaticus]